MSSPLRSVSRAPVVLDDVPLLLGDTEAMAETRARIMAAARTDAKVLITGETGTGKEVVARMIHHFSTRSGQPFVTVNCSAIPEALLESELYGHARGSFTGAFTDTPGLVRQADRGSLFLDELGEASPRLQTVLLRFAESGEYQPVGASGRTPRADTRLICATNRDLTASIEAGQFRRDLYYRLNVIQITVPALRERREDVMLLMQHFLTHAARTHRLGVPAFTPAAVQQLVSYRWPGNVRELKNVAERLVLLQECSGPLGPSDLPPEIVGARGTSASAEQARAGAQASVARVAVPAAVGDQPSADLVGRLWDRMAAGEDFWTVVQPAFKRRELSRTELLALIDRGLQATRGNYGLLLRLFNLPHADYKRFHAFLYQQQCNLPVARYRTRTVEWVPEPDTAA